MEGSWNIVVVIVSVVHWTPYCESSDSERTRSAGFTSREGRKHHVKVAEFGRSPIWLKRGLVGRL
jgi:hypothetical protein